MRTIWTVLFCLTLAVTAWAGTPQDTFNSQLNKVLPPFSAFSATGKLSKYFCTCNNPASADNDMTGVLELFSGVVYCTIYTFDTNGNVSLASGCIPWLPVAR